MTLAFFRRCGAASLTGLVLVASAVPAGAAVKRWPAERGVVFDNGPAIRSSSAASVLPPYENADDFFLSSATRVSGFEWNLSEVPLLGQPLSYLGTTLSVRAAEPDGQPGSVLFTTEAVATRSVWAQASGPSAYDMVRFGVSGLDIDLAPGRYFLGLTQHYADPASIAYFAQAGRARPVGARDGSFFAFDGGDWFAYPEDNSFRVFGSSPALSALPEAGSGGLLLAGLVLLAGRRSTGRRPAWPGARIGRLQ